jgi:undecaprenyl-diphosphatase
MSSLLQSALLGIVQGITEFLPISSTSHLLLFEKALGFETFPGKTFEIVVQFGSGLAIVLLFCRRLFSNTKLPLLLLLATIPVAIVGAAFRHEIKTSLYTPAIISLSLIIGGLFFLFVERFAKSQSSFEGISAKQAGNVGIFQTLALIPGVSRSGSTIASGLFFGIERKAAVEFSFLLAIPALCGAGIIEFVASYPSLTTEGSLILFTGFTTAFLSSLLVIRPLINFIERRGLMPFGWYRIVLGLLLFIT